MDVFHPLIVIFFSVSTMVLSFAFFGVLEAEYRKRKLPHLRLMGLVQLVTGLDHLCFIAGQILYLNGNVALGGVFIDQAQGILLAFAGLFAVLGLLAFLEPSRLRTLSGIAMVFAFFVGVTRTLSSPSSIVTVDGFPIAGLTTGEFFTDLLPLVLQWTVTGIIGCVYATRRLQGKIEARPHLTYLSIAGFLGFLLIAVYISVTTQFAPPPALGLVYLLVPPLMASLFAGSVSYRHKNPEITRHPWKVFGTSVLIKIGAVNLVVFFVGCFVLIGVTASSFNAVITSLRQANLRIFVDHVVSVQEASEKVLTDSARAFAVRVVADRLHADPDASHLAALRQVIATRQADGGAATYFAFVDLAGNVTDLHRSSAHVDLASRIAASPVRMGETVVSVRRTPELSGAELVVETPIREDGDIVGFFVVAEQIGTERFSETAFPAGSSSAPISFGMIAKNGDLIFSTGAGIDVSSVLAALPRGDEDALVGGEEVLIGRVSRSGATVYAFSPMASTRGTLLSVIFAVVVLALSITVALAAFQLFSISAILSPLRKLTIMTRRMASGDYRVRSDHRSLDETGELSDSFNQMAETIQSRTRTLEDLLRQQKDFMLHTVHELRNPLNHFRWTLELMRFGEAGKLTPEQLSLVEQMHTTNLRLEHMVQNIIDTEKLSENRLLLSMEELDIIPIIDDVAGEVSVQAREKMVGFRWEHPKGGLPKLMGDKDQMRRIISNIAGNAVKYTDKGGMVIISAEAVAGEAGKPAIAVTVSDDGRGIPKKDQPHLFARFYRASNVVKKDFEGTGLGLYIVHKLVELHGGTVRFESEEGKGTIFVVTFPAVHPSKP